MKLLLIAPKWPNDSLWGQIYFRFPLLSLTSLAAMTGDQWEVTLIDESATPINFEQRVDLVAITLMTPLAKRGYEIADRFRQDGVTVVMGGIHATMMPDEAAQHADAVVLGEAEATWPQVLSDFEKERLQPRYSTDAYSELIGLNIPRRELLQRKAYFFTNTLQTTRGCPFDCDFCSVTAFYGCTYRVRPIQEVVDEINQMQRGFLFFVDDNIVGRPTYAKELFKALIPLKVAWFSQAALSIAKDETLLRLAKESGCRGLFIGFESLSQKSLKAMGKAPNRVSEFQQAVQRIHDYGIGIQGSFIFGTDFDTTDVFAQVTDFVEDVRLEAAIFSVLTPFPGTRIYDKLKSENRILHSDWNQYDMNHVVFHPKQMSPEQLQEGLHWAYRRLYGWRSIFKRIRLVNRNFLFFLIQNIGFRRAWQKALQAYIKTNSLNMRGV